MRQKLIDEEPKHFFTMDTCRINPSQFQQAEISPKITSKQSDPITQKRFNIPKLAFLEHLSHLVSENSWQNKYVWRMIIKSWTTLKTKLKSLKQLKNLRVQMTTKIDLWRTRTGFLINLSTIKSLNLINIAISKEFSST